MYARGHPSGAWRQPVVPVCSAVQVYMFWRVRFTPRRLLIAWLLLLSCSQPAVLLAFYLSYVPCTIYRLDSKTLATLLIFTFWLFWEEIECKVHIF